MRKPKNRYTKTVKKPSKKRDPAEVYAEYMATLEPLVFIDRSNMNALLAKLKEVIPKKVIDANPELLRLLKAVSIAVKSQNEVREKLLNAQLSRTDKTKEKSDKRISR